MECPAEMQASSRTPAHVSLKTERSRSPVVGQSRIRALASIRYEVELIPQTTRGRRYLELRPVPRPEHTLSQIELKSMLIYHT